MEVFLFFSQTDELALVEATMQAWERIQWAEPFGLAMVEAMASGSAVLWGAAAAAVAALARAGGGGVHAHGAAWWGAATRR